MAAPSTAGDAAPPWDLVVVGAGAAGLACARVARAAGLRVLLLEARDRCGGRAWSSDAFGVGVEIDHGATWVHAVCPGNPIVHLARARHAHLHAAGEGCPYVFDVAAGDVLARRDMRPYYEAIASAFEVVDAANEKSKLDTHPEGDESLLQAMIEAGLRLQPDDAAGSGQHKKGGKKKSGKARKSNMAPHVLRWGLTWQLELNEGTGVENISAKHYDESDEMSGCNHFFQGGYGAFVRSLVEGPLTAATDSAKPRGDEEAPPELRLGEAVAEISWPSGQSAVDELVRIVAVGGAEHAARRVVVTLPLGVLKAGDVAFHPPLPPRKSMAIERLGCAAYAKVNLRFPQRFWKEGVTGFSLCGIGVEEPEAVFERAWFFPCAQFGDGVDDVFILSALLVGKAAEIVQDVSDALLCKAATAALRRAARCSDAGHVFATTKGESLVPCAVHAARWLADPYARGCWTTFAPGCAGPADCAALAEPLGEGQCLRFAGEHTAEADGGSVHGAWLTGLREAEAVLLACLSEGRFSGGEAVERAARWMLYCRDALARAKAMQEHAAEEENESESSSSSSE